MEAEAIILRRGAYHISIRPKNSACCEDSLKTLRGGSMPSEVPLVGTPGWTREAVDRELPNMHTLFGDSIFLRSKQEHVLKRILLDNNAFARSPISRSPMAIVGGRGNRQIQNLSTSATSVPGISPQGRATAAVKAWRLVKCRKLAWEIIGQLCKLAVVK